MAIGNVNEFVSICEGEVSILENIFPGGSLILCDASVINAR